MASKDDLPVRVSSLEVTSSDDQKPHVFDTMLRSLLGARTRKSLFDRMLVTVNRIESLGVYRNVTIGAEPGPEVGDVDIKVKLAELDHEVNLGVEVGGGSGGAAAGDILGGISGSMVKAEGQVTARGTTNHNFGVGDSLSASYSQSQAGSHVMSARASVPTIAGLFAPADVSLFSDSNSYTERSGFTEHIKGLTANVSDPEKRHVLSYNMHWRDIDPVRNSEKLFKCAASPEIIADAHATLKSSLSYKYETTTIDHAKPPTRGGSFSLATEIAGLAGDVKYGKLVAQTSTNVSWFYHGGFRGGLGSDGTEAKARAGGKHPDFSWQSPAATLRLTVGAGTLWPIGKRPGTTVLDRFFVGGANTVRGFKDAGVGPRGSPVEKGLPTGDALGADHYASLAAQLILPPPLPFDTVASFGARTHLWASAALAVPHAQRELVKTDPLSIARAAVGYGVILPLPTAMGTVCLEFNHALKHKACASDLATTTSFGLSFFK